MSSISIRDIEMYYEQSGHGPDLAEHIQNAQLQVITDCGHAPFIEQPDSFYQLIRTFLDPDAG